MLIGASAACLGCPTPGGRSGSAAPTGPAVVISSPRLGIVNLAGAAAQPLIAADAEALTPLFGEPARSDGAPPSCDVLMFYGKLDATGKIAGSALGLRDFIERSGAKLLIVATENDGNAYVAAAAGKTPRANLVMTVERRGTAFPRFFRRLFARMFSGETMEQAWVALAPQVPGAEAPSTIFSSALGPLTFRGGAPSL
jgi:hypothetical protein